MAQARKPAAKKSTAARKNHDCVVVATGKSAAPA